MTLKKGDKAPDFQLPSTKTETFKLSENLSGKGIILAFYPFDWSPVCTNELGYFNANYNEFKAVDISLAAISVDSPFSHSAWAESQKLKFPLLSDFNKEVVTAYGVLLHEFHGLKNFAKRSVFLVDRDGIIQYVWISENPGMEPEYTELLDAAAEL
jgi:peroxiredoxin